MSHPTRIEHPVDIPGHGQTLVHEVAGPDGAPTLLLLHGLGATANLNWGCCYRPLAQHFRVFAVDHRGHGHGLRTRRFRLEQCADDAVAAAEAIGAKRFIAVGYSMGGPIASLAWRRHRERLCGLVLCATARHFAPRGIARLARASLPVAAAASRLAPRLVRERILQRMLVRIEHPELRDRLYRELLGHEPASVIQAAGALMRFSSHDWIGGVDVPTAVVVTTCDALVPPSRQYELAASIPGARIFEVADDHDACIRRPFAEALVAACRAVAARAG